MPYTVKPDGSITVDSLEEAIALQQRILSKKTWASPRSTGVVTFDSDEPNSKTVVFLEKLKAYDGKTLNSEQMKKIVGTDTSTGVGPRLRYYRNALHREGQSLDTYVQPKKANDGTTTWVIRFSSTLPSA